MDSTPQIRPDQDSGVPAESAQIDPLQGDPLQTLGNVLREGRSGQGIERLALAQRLHMGDEQLAALEQGDRSRLPELVFVIAQARRVATALGLDIDALLIPLKLESQAAAKSAATTSTASQTRSNPEPPAGTGRRPRAQISAQSYTTARTAAPIRPGKKRRAIAWLALLAGLGTAGSWAWQQGPRWQPVLTMPWSFVNRPTTANSTSGSATQTPKPRAITKAKPITKTVKAPVPSDQLVLKAAQPSWVEVRNQQGTTLFEGTLEGERRFPLGGGLRVLAGRPDLVQASVGAAQAKALGSIDQVDWVSIPASPSATAKAPMAAKPAPTR